MHPCDLEESDAPDEYPDRWGKGTQMEREEYLRLLGSTMPRWVQATVKGPLPNWFSLYSPVAEKRFPQLERLALLSQVDAQEARMRRVDGLDDHTVDCGELFRKLPKLRWVEVHDGVRSGLNTLKLPWSNLRRLTVMEGCHWSLDDLLSVLQATHRLTHLSLHLSPKNRQIRPKYWTPPFHPSTIVCLPQRKVLRFSIFFTNVKSLSPRRRSVLKAAFTYTCTSLRLPALEDVFWEQQCTHRMTPPRSSRK